MSEAKVLLISQAMKGFSRCRDGMEEKLMEPFSEERRNFPPEIKRVWRTQRKTITVHSLDWPSPLTDNAQLDPCVPRRALVEVHSTPVQAIVGVGGVVYNECRRWTSGCLEVGASSELLLVHPMRTLLKL